MKQENHILKVTGLSIYFGVNKVVDNSSFDLVQGEILGIVGESGSGKTMTALSIIDLLHKNARVEGSIVFGSTELTKLTKEQYEKLKGKELGMVFQEPMTSFNPLLTIGQQMNELFEIHGVVEKSSDRKNAIYDALKDVGLNQVDIIYGQYPHELSGGMRQRAMLAMAMLLKPKILIADEPTTALDVTVQKKILELMKSLNEKYGTSIILISHDLGVINSICHRMIVMQHGRIVEQGLSSDIFNSPTEHYTKELLEAIPKKVKKHMLKAVNIDEIDNNHLTSMKVLEVENVNVYYENKEKTFLGRKKKKLVVKNANLYINEGESLGIVGESGSGKSTLAKAIVGLNQLYEGNITLAFARPQMVFQDPYSSLNPMKRVASILEEPLILSKVKDKKKRLHRVEEILEEVGLSKSHGERYIHELSGGQRQRIAIGVALIQNAKFIVLDEPVSALDVTVQAQILDLLVGLQNKHGLSYLFISHDLNIVYQMCNRVCVMHQGQIIEYGNTEEIFNHPKEEYTTQLLDAVLHV